MKVTESNKCDSCVHDIDYIEHFFFECPVIKSFWKTVESIIMSKTGKLNMFSCTDILFGMTSKDLSLNDINDINHILLIGKMSISIARKTKSLSSINIIFEHHLSIRKKYISLLSQQ